MPEKVDPYTMAIMRAVNRIIVATEELYGEHKISRERADQRIKTARSVGAFLMNNPKKLKGGEN